MTNFQHKDVQMTDSNVVDLGDYKDRKFEARLDQIEEDDEQMTLAVVSSIDNYIDRVAAMHGVSPALVGQSVLMALMGRASEEIRENDDGAWKDLLLYTGEVAEELAEGLDVDGGRDTERRNVWRAMMYAHHWQEES